KLAKIHRPDLILLDISLPAGDGFHLAEQLNRLTETRDTPIIITTASADPALREKALELGAVGLLRKPFNPEELVPVVEDVFGWWKGSNLPDVEQRPKMPGPGAKKILIVEDDHKLAA